MKSLIRRRFFRPIEGEIGLPRQGSPKVETNEADGGVVREAPSEGADLPANPNLESHRGGPERQ